MNSAPTDFNPPFPYFFAPTPTASSSKSPYSFNSGDDTALAPGPSESLADSSGNPSSYFSRLPPTTQDHVRRLAHKLADIILLEIERDPEGMSKGKSKASFILESDFDDESPPYHDDFDKQRYRGDYRNPSSPLDSSPAPPGPSSSNEPLAPPAVQTLTSTSDPVRAAIDHQINLVFDYFEHRCPGLLVDNPGLTIGEPMNPLLLGSTFAATFCFLSGLSSPPDRAAQVADSKDLLTRLLPLFHAIQDHSRGSIFKGRIQTVGRDEEVDPDADFVFMKKRHFDSYIADVQNKVDELLIRPFEGYPVPSTIRREDIHLAETARRSLEFSIDGHTTISPPIPAHLLHNAIALRRYVEQCFPGTPFFENCPPEVIIAREVFEACRCCGLFQVGDIHICSDDRTAERARFAEGYETIQSYQTLYYVPAFLRDDFARHHFTYASVYPGSYFLFSRVPIAIAIARNNYKVCVECGLLHKAGFTANSYSCPYPLKALAEAAIYAHGLRENYISRPPLNRLY